MSDTTTQTSLQTTINTLNTLVPLAASTVAIIGGVPVPVVAGLQVAQALLPVAEKFLLQIGNGTVTIDTNHANDTNAIIAALQADVAAGWPMLSFLPTPPTPPVEDIVATRVQPPPQPGSIGL